LNNLSYEKITPIVGSDFFLQFYHENVIVVIFLQNIKPFKTYLMPATISPYEKEILLQTNCRKAAVEFIKIINDLWYDEAIELVIFRNPLIDKNVNEILINSTAAFRQLVCRRISFS
jgi:glyceraldehyde 3-phosphate dehydrogenase